MNQDYRTIYLLISSCPPIPLQLDFFFAPLRSFPFVIPLWKFDFGRGRASS
jgi:hypothetical protein